MTGLLALAFLVLLCVAIVGKVLVSAIRRLRPTYRPRWLLILERLVPSWRLFGQRGGSFDLYPVFGDRVGGGDEHIHLSNGQTRRWFHPFVNPYSKYRFMVRETMQIALFHHLSGLTNRPKNLGATALLESITKDASRQLHPNDYQTRQINLYVVFDRGHHSTDTPEAKLVLGPFGY